MPETISSPETGADMQDMQDWANRHLDGDDEGGEEETNEEYNPQECVDDLLSVADELDGLGQADLAQRVRDAADTFQEEIGKEKGRDNAEEGGDDEEEPGDLDEEKMRDNVEAINEEVARYREGEATQPSEGLSKLSSSIGPEIAKGLEEWAKSRKTFEDFEALGERIGADDPKAFAGWLQAMKEGTGV